MECDLFRQMICEDPARAEPELVVHEQACEACAAFAIRAREAEHLIQQTLRFDVHQMRDLSTAAPQPRRRDARTLIAGVAAVFVAAIAVWFALNVGAPVTNQELAAGVLAHWDHEPESWAVNNVSVSPVVLERALDGKATIDSTRIGTVSYARSCWIAGQWLPHLVVQSEQGPVMVILVPEQQLEQNLPLSLPEQGLGGNLRQVDGGGIAVLGDDSQALAPVEQRIVDAIQLRI